MKSSTEQSLVACVDVDYRTGSAHAAGIWFRGWTVADEEFAVTVASEVASPYRSGEFYRRELPCLLNVLGKGLRPDYIIVDGYVSLDDGRPGLGMHLYQALHESAVVVGVAKTRFAGATGVLPICRGTSRVPLFISSAGIPVAAAADFVLSMHGPYRIPTMLKRVDRLARTKVTELETP